MDREVILATKIGIALVFLATAIGIGIFINNITYRSTQVSAEMVDKNENNSDGAKAYKEYDNTYVTGNEVINVLYKNDFNDLAILVSTKYFDEKKDSCGNKFNQLPGTSGNYASHGNDVPVILVTTKEDLANKKCTIQDKRGLFINYRSIIGGLGYNYNGVSNYSLTYNNYTYYAGGMYLDGSRYKTTCSKLQGENNNQIHNNSTNYVSNNTSVEYIAPGGLYLSRLVMDEYNNVMGLAFMQQSV